MSLSFQISPQNAHSYEIKMNDGGNFFYSELSHLEGFSSETIEEALHQLKEVIAHLSSAIDLTQLDFKKDFFNLISFPNKAYPSVLFAIEGLLLQLIPKNETEKKFQVNDLIFLEQPETFSKNIKLSSVLKIKIGKKSPEEESEQIRSLLQNHPEVTLIRLDANRNLELRDLGIYPCSKLEYFESPLKEFRDYQNCPYPIAFDEDIELLSESSLPSCAKALVFKPKVRLGISGMIKLIARYPNLTPILTHSYEGIWGRKVLENLPLWFPVFNQGFQGLKFKD